MSRADKNDGPHPGGEPSVKDAGLNERIYRLVKEIPSGQVATYGQIAKIVGSCTPRQAGYAMAAAPDSIPWQRVVNSAGQVSTRSSGDGADRQRALLQDEGIVLDEGIVFTKAGKLKFDDFGWAGPDPDVQEHHGFHQTLPAGMRG